MGRYADAVSQILLEQGRARAQGALGSGQAWGQAVQQLGQIPGQIVQQQQQLQDAAQQRDVRAQQIATAKAAEQDRQRQIAAAGALTTQDTALRNLYTDPANPPSLTDVSRVVGPERGVKIFEGYAAYRKLQQGEYDDLQARLHKVMLGLQASSEDQRAAAWPGLRQTLIDAGAMKPEDAPAVYDPVWYQSKVDYGKEAAKVGTREVKTRNPDGSETIQLVKDEPTTTPFTSAAPPKPDHLVTTTGPDGRPVQRLATEAELKAGVPGYRAPTAAPDRAPFWVNRGGKMIRISEAQYQPGDLPASTREQGRPVTANDASDLADFDTTQDELAAVRAAIGPADSTGILAQVGARIPYVTQVTGWGTDAKKRQAVIDRVKQVIGKTLEGGVLRKEDEAKYEKILPTIGDAPDVASAKLDGLDAAIRQRKSRRLDALADAGYDTTKFETRAPRAPADRTLVTLRAPNGDVSEVPADQVAHYLGLGATRVP